MKKGTAHKRGNRQRPRRKQTTHSIKNLMKLSYKIELTLLPKEEGAGYFASIPLLKGCHSDGRTPDETINNLWEAQRAWFGSALKHGDSIPLPQ